MSDIEQKYPIELVVTERNIQNGVITVKYTDAFGINRVSSTKFNYYTFRFGDDLRPPDDRQFGATSLPDIMSIILEPAQITPEK